MAKIANKILWWSSVDDAENYGIRIIPDETPFNYEQEAIIVPDTNSAEIEYDLSGTVLEEGIYDIYVTAIDLAGNESDPLEFLDAVLDFVPPSAPSQGGFR